MTHKKIRIPKESANEILRALGSLKNGVEFEDLTKDNMILLTQKCENIVMKNQNY